MPFILSLSRTQEAPPAEIIVDAGPDQSINSGATVQLDGDAPDGASWSTSGTGTFDDAFALDAVYTPSLDDIIRNSVTLTLSLGSTTDSLTVTIAQVVLAHFPEDNTKLFTDTARTTPVSSDGDSVAAWADISGNGHHASQATSGDRPIYRVPTAVDFVSADVLAASHNAALNLVGGLTIHVVANMDAIPGRFVNKCATNGGTNNPYDVGVLTGGVPYMVRADATGGVGHGLLLRPQNYTGYTTGSKKKMTVTDGVGFFSNIRKTAGPLRSAWQGCATNGTNVYLITDRTDPISTLHNNLSVFDMEGNFIETLTDVWTKNVGGTDMVFVDGMFHTDGYLYVCVTNFHTNSEIETEAAVVVLDPENDFAEVAYHDVAPTNALSSLEGVAFRSNEWWVCYSGTNVIKRYNSSWVFQADHTLPAHPSANNAPPVSWYQSIFWDGDTLYANLHAGQGGSYFTAPGIDVFTYSGGTFTRQGRIKPPGNGCGQGMAKHGTKWYFGDRWSSELVVCDYAGAGLGDSIPGQVIFYVDGVVVGYDSNWLINGPGTNTEVLRLGKRADAASNLDGKLFSVRIYNTGLRKTLVENL